jgi:thiamine biosynthesis protein ThiS
VRVTVNGETRTEIAGTVAALLADLGFDGRKIAVERNRAIVPKSLWSATALADGDQIEIVHFVGGG